MKNKHFTLNVIMVLIAITPLIYLAIVYQNLPARLATHFDAHLQPDRIEDKSQVWIGPSIMAFVSIFTLLLMENIHKIDPKRMNTQEAPVFTKLGAGLVIFLTALSFLIILSSIKGTFILSGFMFPLLGLLFAFIGNYMHNIKPNFFAGLRLPWTLSDNDNWRLTHLLAGKIWFWGGIFIAVVSMFLPIQLLVPVFLSITGILVLVPVIYSYRLFRQKQQANG